MEAKEAEISRLMEELKRKEVENKKLREELNKYQQLHTKEAEIEKLKEELRIGRSTDVVGQPPQSPQPAAVNGTASSGEKWVAN